MMMMMMMKMTILKKKKVRIMLVSERIRVLNNMNVRTSIEDRRRQEILTKIMKEEGERR